ncbi:hypothetical protein K470DRAFT_220322 [Piedraia hortae CBS 480.64]|uniref:Endoplasmic reticulum-based factor for assembly of V-ATPase n=1 Tax=Piedraia hortae CBS 480.64 TaxID=1314780 RepID=A0A6A7BUK2_9PEZI|nr:hypothetical protein K470DRAFT_220322 [Piedraia hortae CBS 480.64]
MVRLTITEAAKAAVDEYQRVKRGNDFEDAHVGSPIDHDDLIKVSQFLVNRSSDHSQQKKWRLDTLLKGAMVYQSRPPPKRETTPEYQALMKHLKEEEERRQYERMTNAEKILSNGELNPHISHGTGPSADEPDDVTYADVNRQVVLIINVLVSIVACSVSIWVAARRWDVPQRLGLSMFGSVLVAAAEIAIYFGYIRRIKEAKGRERKKREQKQIVKTWVIETNEPSDGLRYRKGKHR